MKIYEKVCILLAYPVLFSQISCTSAKIKTESEKDAAHKMIRAGKSEDAKKFFEDGGINAADSDGNTALHIAAIMDDGEMANFLAEKGADLEIRNNSGDTPLLCAVKKNSANAGNALALLGADIFAKDRNGSTALENALKKKDDSWLKIMINERTAVLRDSNGESIVHYFARTKNEKAVNFCISQGVDCAAVSNKNETPLSIALSSPENYSSAKIAANLLLYGVPQIGGACEYFEKTVLSHNLLLRFEDGQTALHIATIMNHQGIADWILHEKSTIPLSLVLLARDVAGSAPLHEAVRYGRIEIAKKLLEAKCDANCADALGNTPLLILPPKEIQKEIKSLLLENGADINAKDSFGDTILHKSTLSKADLDFMDFLLQKGAEINARNKDGATPLSVAIDLREDSHVDFYASRGADIYALDTNGSTPLSKAIQSADIEIFKCLMSKNENAKSKDSFGNTPLHIAISMNAPDSFVSYLVQNGADANARNSSGESVLLLAAQRNRKTAGELLIESGADIFAEDTKNNSPLKVALANPKTRSWFLNGKTLSMKDGAQNSPLHYAAEWKMTEAAILLLGRNANAKETNSSGETPVFSAVKSNSAELVKLLFDAGSPLDSSDSLSRDIMGNTPLHKAVKFGSIEAAKELVSLGIDIDAENFSGRTALADACRAGNETFVRFLIESGANANAQDSRGRTVLMDAIFANRDEMIPLLLENGANPNEKDTDGRTALHEAVKIGSKNAISILKNAGADALSRDKTGETPLSIALFKDEDVLSLVLDGVEKNISGGDSPILIAVKNKASKKTLETILNMGFSFDERNEYGETPLFVCAKENYSSLAQILLEKGANPFLKSSGGKCPLEIALETKNSYLLESIAKFNSQKTDKSGNTILHYAAKTADKKTVSRLIALGLNKNAKNISAETPKNVAERWNRKDIAELLK